MLNQRGQAFSVFKLLIAAVIAVTILGILLLIIGRINIFGQGDPQEEASKIVNDLVAQPGVVKTSGEVIFKTNAGLSDRGIAAATRGSLSDNQVCILPGDFLDDVPDRFQYFGEGRSVIYQGSQPQNAQITAICDTGSGIANYRGGNYFQDYTGQNGIDDSWVGDCGCLDSRFNQKCCIVAIKRFTG